MSDGISPLQQAASMDHTMSDGISPLQQAASVDYTMSDGISPLQQAASMDHTMSDGISPLQQAASVDYTMSDGISPLQQAASVDYTDMQHGQRGTEAFENVTHLNRTEAKYPTSSHRQVFPASSSQRRSPTPFPHFTALTGARLGCNESRLKFPSVANPVHQMSVHVPHHTAETGGASGRETTGIDPNASDTRSRMDPELFLHVVYSLLCFRCCR